MTEHNHGVLAASDQKHGAIPVSARMQASGGRAHAPERNSTIISGAAVEDPNAAEARVCEGRHHIADREDQSLDANKFTRQATRALVEELHEILI